MINKEQIEEIKSKIVERIYEQVLNGKQSTTLNEQNTKACGQFLQKELQQRGIHGTSAALRVLSNNDESKTKPLISQLVNYLENRKEIELKINRERSKDLDNDGNNIIKLSEQLYSLSFIKAGQTNKPIVLINLLEGQLRQCKIENRGWSCFIDDTSKIVEILPTAFAVMGLYANNFEDNEAENYLIEQLNTLKTSGLKDPSMFAIMVFTLYVITFKANNKNRKDKTLKKQLNHIFDILWDSKFSFLDENIEQNIEYWNDIENFYVRIPWQLYLISLASYYSQLSFSKVKTQNRLSSIYTSEVTNGGFKYKYSGKFLSTRTDAIVFDTLSIVENNLGKTWYDVLNLVDKIGSFLGGNKVRKFIVLIICLWFIYISWLWFNSDIDMHKKLEELGPHTFVFLVIAIYEFGRRTK